MRDWTIVGIYEGVAGSRDRYVVEGFMAGDGLTTEVAEGYAGVLEVVAHYLGIEYGPSLQGRHKYEGRKKLAEAAAEKEQLLVLNESLEPNGHWRPLTDLPPWLSSLLSRRKDEDLRGLPEGWVEGAPPLFVCRHRLPGDVLLANGWIEIFDPLSEVSLVRSFVDGGFLSIRRL